MQLLVLVVAAESLENVGSLDAVVIQSTAIEIHIYNAGLKLIQGHQGYGRGCPFDWPQCPSHWPWRFVVPFPILPICAVI